MVIGDMPAEPRTGHMGCSDPQPSEPTPTSVGSEGCSIRASGAAPVSRHR